VLKTINKKLYLREMIIIEIEGNEYNLPQGWDEVTLDMFEKISSHSLLLSEFKSETLFSLEMFSILLKCPVNDIKKLTRKSFEILAEKCAWANKEIVPRKVKKFLIDGEVYVPVKDLNSLTMGDSVSLELMINESNESNILTNILPIILRKGKTILKGSKEVLVPSEFDADNYGETRELFKQNLMVSDIIEFKLFFLNGGK
jgi:hypothetical protein